MSPEQARGEGHLVDGRSDIFSLGIVLYLLLAGEPPFTGSTGKSILQQVIHKEARPPRQLDGRIPRELERICLKALAKRAENRYTTALDMAEDLRAYIQMAPSQEHLPADRSPPAGQPVDSETRVVPEGATILRRHGCGFFHRPVTRSSGPLRVAGEHPLSGRPGSRSRTRTGRFG
jgi:eukaryotic-like serine/threonine-protein kinase